ncbi:MAG TPA: carbon-nitrogen family hydrolase [Selenomonadales bacterium]|nr:carbon-nitrogen family hydrolase [Selenomonadales bacterium]
MKVALVQMTVAAGDVAENRRRGIAMTEEAAGRAEVVVLPEIWTTGYALRQVAEWAETETGPTITALAAIARRSGAAIIAGSLAMRVGDKIGNRSVVIGPDGRIAAGYEKLHLFSMTGEERFFAPGDRRTVFALAGMKAGLAICYDLRFPELFRRLALDGAQAIFLPAEWPAARGAHWDILVRARAVENQVYICAVNCVGEHRGSRFYGHSMLVGPEGQVLAEGGDAEGVIYGEIDPAVVAEARETMRVWQDRREEVY